MVRPRTAVEGPWEGKGMEGRRQREESGEEEEEVLVCVSVCVAEPHTNSATPRHATPRHTTPHHAIPHYSNPIHTKVEYHIMPR